MERRKKRGGQYSLLTLMEPITPHLCHYWFPPMVRILVVFLKSRPSITNPLRDQRLSTGTYLHHTGTALHPPTLQYTGTALHPHAL